MERKPAVLQQLDPPDPGVGRFVIEAEAAVGPGRGGQEPQLFIKMKGSDRLAAPPGEIAAFPKLSGRALHGPSVSFHEPHHTRTYRYDSREIGEIQLRRGWRTLSMRDKLL